MSLFAQKGDPINILILILILSAFGFLPGVGNFHSFGYFLSGTLGLVVIVLLILVIMGRV